MGSEINFEAFDPCLFLTPDLFEEEIHGSDATIDTRKYESWFTSQVGRSQEIQH